MDKKILPLGKCSTFKWWHKKSNGHRLLYENTWKKTK